MSAVNNFLSDHNYGGRSSNMYTVPKKEFGKISREYDMKGEGYWFSVDRNGVVRHHSYSSSGFGKS